MSTTFLFPKLHLPPHTLHPTTSHHHFIHTITRHVSLLYLTHTHTNTHTPSLPRDLISSSSGFICIRRASKMYCPSKNPDGSTRAKSTEGEISDSLTHAMMSLMSSLLWWLCSIQRVTAWNISSSGTYRESLERMARTHSLGRGRKEGPERTTLPWWSTNWRHFSLRRETLWSEAWRRMGRTESWSMCSQSWWLRASLSIPIMYRSARDRRSSTTWRRGRE